MCRCHLVYICMVISGIGTLMPWNMFITATAVSAHVPDATAVSAHVLYATTVSARVLVVTAVSARQPGQKSRKYILLFILR